MGCLLSVEAEPSGGAPVSESNSQAVRPTITSLRMVDVFACMRGSRARSAKAEQAQLGLV